MKSITKQKSLEEITQQLEKFNRIYIAGCGTCATMMMTGGHNEVLVMKDHLQDLGKLVTGWTVIPTACDEMTKTAIEENDTAISNSNCILVMSCALGVHRLSLYLKQPVIPALDTLFIGLEDNVGSFHEVCAQCGQCILGETAGICPISTCHKGLVNGPCGGTNNGKCEVDKTKDCAWTLIYERLKEQGRLELMHKYQPPKNQQAVPRPRIVSLNEVGGNNGVEV